MLRGSIPSARAPFWPPADMPRGSSSPASTADGDATSDLTPEAKPGPKGKKGKRGGPSHGLIPHGDGWVEPPKKLANKVLRAVLQHGKHAFELGYR